MAELIAASRVGCSFATLPANFYTRVRPRALTRPRLLHFSPEAAGLIGLAAEDCLGTAFLAMCSGGGMLAGVEPLASVYSGHQFGVWAGQLGDGRAHLLGDVTAGHGTWEVQLKGSGRTPYSRMGDGWAVLRSSVREYLACEAMAGLGIPTTRALALVASGDPVMREQAETAAIVTRLSPSFVRFGHFEHWAGHLAEQQALLDYVVQRFYPACRLGTPSAPDYPATALALLSEVTRRTAQLIAQWQLAGFCHGVMNTDNMSILGLTLDYGPYGFMDAFSAGHVCNHSDVQGRYAWNMQPAVAQWNLYRLAESFQVLGCSADDLESCLKPFEQAFLRAWHQGLACKFGWSGWNAEDMALENDWWALLESQHADFTLAFRRLSQVDVAPHAWLSLFGEPENARAWLQRYRVRLQSEPMAPALRAARMDRANPLYVLRNHLAQEAIVAARQGDASVLDRLQSVLREPCVEHPGAAYFALPPAADARAVAVSCSS